MVTEMPGHVRTVPQTPTLGTTGLSQLPVARTASSVVILLLKVPL